MIISIDYDDTWSADPQVWSQVAKLFRSRGHTVILVTNRYEIFGKPVLRACSGRVHNIIFAGSKPKRDAAKEQGYEVDVWIDDYPESILYGR